MTEKAKLMTDAEIDGIAAGTMQDCHLREFLSLCQQAQLANAQAERLERLEDGIKEAMRQLWWITSWGTLEPTAFALGAEEKLLAALSPSTTKGEG